MRHKILTRRTLLFGMGGFVFGSALTGVIGFRYRNELRRLLGQERATAARVFAANVGDDGWLLSPDERAELEEQDEIVVSDVLEIRDAVDLPGGDYDSFRALSLQDCVSSCESQKECSAFTYARVSHPVKTKRKMCWLKGSVKSKPIISSPHYVSGRKGEW